MSLDEEVLKILPLFGRPAGTVELVKRGNDVFRLVSGAECFFLKTYTKDWYGSDPASDGFPATHESTAWAILAAHKIAVPEVAYVCATRDNPISRPFVLTRQLDGRPLTGWLAELRLEERFALIAAIGDYLRRMHAITFEFSGYLSRLAGPAAPPEPTGWQHRCWSAGARAAQAEQLLQTDKALLTPATYAAARRVCADMAGRLEGAYRPPRFTHGDCHAHQFFIVRRETGWHVAGVVDMEVTSAGDCTEDLLKISLELAQSLGHTTRWWEALFAGYGQAPDFDLFRLRLLGVAPAEYGPARKWVRTTSREAVIRRLLEAQDWPSLFAPIGPPGSG